MSEKPSLIYPPSKTVEQVDVYHGVEVADPYRWLEADVRQSAAVQSWVVSQQQFADRYLQALPKRQVLRERLAQVWDIEQFGVPVKKAGRYFYSYNSGTDKQNRIMMQKALDDPATVLFDPNTWSDDGTTTLAAYYPDPTGRYVAYLVQEAGSDWRVARVRNLETGVDLEDQLHWLKFTGLSWLADGSGFYYSGYPDPGDDKYHGLPDQNSIYFHKIGQPQSEDTLVYHNLEAPEWRYAAMVTEDGAYLVIIVFTGTDARYQVLTKPLGTDEPLTFLVRGFDHDYSPVGHADGWLYFRTDMEAPRGRIIRLNPALGEQALDHYEEVVAQHESVLLGADIFGGKLLTQYLKDAASEVAVFTLGGELAHRLSLPGIGTAEGFAGSVEDTEVFFGFSGIDYAPAVLRLDMATAAVSEYKRAEFDVDVDSFVTSQVFYPSADGTQIPMFISHHKDIELDGSNPTLLYGYGGFNVSLTPTFSITRAVWMEQGGVMAVANLRGGGEYGESWHEAGTRLNKQNVFDDFIAAGEYLIAQGYTRPEHLGIMGGSNGGLLVGAVLNQRPELFGAAIPAVGVMDMLRFAQFTAGVFWVDDYGSVDNPEEFSALLAYSPYHNLKQQNYPPVLVSTADTDDRVVPGHSFKYAARLQAVQQGDAPVLLRIESKAGHGAGTPKDKLIDTYADYWAFLLRHLRQVDYLEDKN